MNLCIHTTIGYSDNSQIELTVAAKVFLVYKRHNVTYGARPLKRTIQWLILDPLALHVLQGKFTDGDTIVVNLEKGKIVFYKEEKRVKTARPVAKKAA